MIIMKKNTTTLHSCLGLALGSALLLSSCSLKESPKDQIPEGDAYQNSTLIYLNTVASLYNEVGATGGGNGLGGTDRSVYDLNTFTSDEAMLPTRGSDWDDGGVWRDLFSHNWIADNAIVKGTWDYLYRVIGKTNASLDRLTELKAANPENETFDVYIAELRAFRAMYYFYAMDLFGNIPIVTKGDQQIADVKQSARPEVYAFVVNELTEVLPLLSESNSSKPGEYYGRVTKAVGAFLLAKLALNANVYADPDWTDGNTGAYTFTVDGKETPAYEAVIYYADLIASLGYELEGDFKRNFAVNNETSKENIFVIPMDPTAYASRFMNYNRTLHYSHAPAYGFTGWNGASATREALEVFRRGGDDPRMEMTYFTGQVFGPDGSPILDDGKELFYKPDVVELYQPDGPDQKIAGARMAKYEIDTSSQADGQLVHNDYVLYRYADVLLMKAEALVRLGRSGDEPFGQVRARVGATARTATLDNILDERLLELAWEGHRRNDLIRFGKYDNAVKNLPSNDRIHPVLGLSRTVFPIPGEVLNLNSNLKQNPGY